MASFLICSVGNLRACNNAVKNKSRNEAHLTDHSVRGSDPPVELAELSETIIVLPENVDNVSFLRCIHAPRGRGSQLVAGAAAAQGEWLLFLHADTRLGLGWQAALAAAMTRPDRAAYFRFALDDPSPAARRLERAVAWRCRILALPYGDQGLFISRALYDEVGGYRPLPLMEDVDLVRRLGRRRLHGLDGARHHLGRALAARRLPPALGEEPGASGAVAPRRRRSPPREALRTKVTLQISRAPTARPLRCS
jgi:hypothetical protein